MYGPPTWRAHLCFQMNYKFLSQICQMGILLLDVPLCAAFPVNTRASIPLPYTSQSPTLPRGISWLLPALFFGHT
jgi:hypothetical protein